MLYLKTQVTKWFNDRGNWFLCDHFNMVTGVTVHNVEYLDIDTIRTAVNGWAKPIVAPGANPIAIVAEMQSDLIGFIPTPMGERKTYFGDGDHDFCHGLITMESVEVEPTQKDVTEIEKDIERISSMVRDLQIKRKEVLKKVRQSREQDIVELERAQDDLVTLERVKENLDIIGQ